jgi:aryl-alcohol dehydrogenase-like predicted oxidoreductase
MSPSTSIRAAKMRPLGRTGLQVSEIGFGAWGIGKALWGETDDAESIKALTRAFELGCNFFDTAYVYGDGHSERLIAEALSGSRDKTILASKIPPANFKWPGQGSLKDAFPADWLAACTERSLKNLKTDVIDLQQFHVWKDEWLDDPAWDKTLSAVQKLKKEGKIRHWGVSINAREPKSALRLVDTGLVEAVQVVFNLFEQEPAGDLFRLCRKHNVGVIARVPFDEGGLTGTLTESTVFAEGEFRQGYFAGGLLAETVRRAKTLEKILVKDGVKTLSDAALKFCMSFPEVSTIIPGMRRVGHVEANLKMLGAAPYPKSSLKSLQTHAWKRTL